MHLQYFDILPKAQKVYTRLMDPLCQQWKLTRNELDVLLFLANNPSQNRAVDIVNRRGISKSHVSLAVTLLEEKGYLTRKTSDADRRTVHLFLTDATGEMVQQGQQLQRQFYEQIHGGISQEEMALWIRINNKISDNILNLSQD